jgi:hypothetical protein
MQILVEDIPSPNPGRRTFHSENRGGFQIFDEHGRMLDSQLGPEVFHNGAYGSSLHPLGDIDGDRFEDFAVSTGIPRFPGSPVDFLTIHSGADGHLLCTIAID